MYSHVSLGSRRSTALAHLRALASTSRPASQLSLLVLTGGDARRRRFVFVIITARSSCSKVRR